MAGDADFLAAASVAAQALTTARNALQVAQAAAAREFPQIDLQPLLDRMASAIGQLSIPAPSVTVQAAAAPQITVEAPHVTVQTPPAPVVHIEAPVTVAAAEAPRVEVTVEAPHVTVQAAQAPDVRVEPQFEVVLPEQVAPHVTVEAPIVNVEAPPAVVVPPPQVHVTVPETKPQPRLPWRVENIRRDRSGFLLAADFVPVEPAAAA